MATKRERFANWWERHFLSIHWIATILATAGLALWVHRLGGRAHFSALLEGNRSALYGTLASLFGSLLGFVIAAVSIALGFSQAKELEVVRKSKHYSDLWKTLTVAVRGLGFATVAALVALLADRDSSPSFYLAYLVFFTALLATFRLLRCIWVLEQLVLTVSHTHGSEE